MRNLIIITALVFICFFIEYFLFNVVGAWLTPNLLLLLVIFFNLYLGVRYGIYTAALAGLIKDSFMISAFGVHLVSFVACCYFLAILQKYFYSRGSRFSRLFIIFTVCSLNILMQFIIQNAFAEFNFFEVLKYIYFPEMVLTLLVSSYVFDKTKQCVLKFSV
jgi:rod shape-determining protein MreD